MHHHRARAGFSFIIANFNNNGRESLFCIVKRFLTICFEISELSLILHCEKTHNNPLLQFMRNFLHTITAVAAVAMPLTGAYAQAAAQGENEKQPSIVLTFAPGTQAARIGVGGAAGYEFSIDWGDGQEVTYNAQAYYSELLKGETVKIYGEDIVILQASNQGIVSADVSGATGLIRLTVNNNEMTTLTLGNHPALNGLYAYENSIGALDVSGCPALKVIDVHENCIQGTIDCSAMSSLSGVDVADNQLTSFILPKHTAVYDVDCSNNNLSSLDVTGLSGLSELACSGNKLTSIDLTGLTAVENIYVDGNELTSLDISPCTSLVKVMAAENKLTSIDLSKTPTLTGVYLQDNQLTSIDVTSNPNVRWLNFGNNNVETVDLSKQPYLSIFIANNNKFTNVDLSNNSALTSIDLSNNMLSAINVSNMSSLSQLHIEGNQIESVDFSKNGYLYGLFCGDNKLTELNISANPYLQRLEAQNNQLTKLDVAANKGIQELLLQGNNMAADELNSMLAALPDVSSVQITDYAPFVRQLNISAMPGTASADIAVAEAKGWIVTATSQGISDLEASDAILVDVIYYNTLGVSSQRPFEGLNIVVETYSDGSRKVSKILK